MWAQSSSCRRRSLRPTTQRGYYDRPALSPVPTDQHRRPIRYVGDPCPEASAFRLWRFLSLLLCICLWTLKLLVSVGKQVRLLCVTGWVGAGLAQKHSAAQARREKTTISTLTSVNGDFSIARHIKLHRLYAEKLEILSPKFWRIDCSFPCLLEASLLVKNGAYYGDLRTRPWPRPRGRCLHAVNSKGRAQASGPHGTRRWFHRGRQDFVRSPSRICCVSPTLTPPKIFRDVASHTCKSLA